MLFNSTTFVLFLSVVFLLYWFVFNRSNDLRNGFLIAVSYFFYGWWDWRFLSLIFISSLSDFIIGKQLFKTSATRQRRSLLILSLVVNLGILGYFKYSNFFMASLVELLNQIGFRANPTSLQLILPVGISFYTFQTLGYSIDIYKKKICPTNNPITFFAFVSFFPQLVAGPIERAARLIPQFENPKSFDYEGAKDGLRRILWGFFKKIVIADSCAKTVNIIFLNFEALSGSTLLLGAVCFAFQIYGDFSGYSDIAVGTARLLGFNLTRNFNLPYFSRNVAEFWRRWHISLSSWFRDYVYISMGGSYTKTLPRIRNIIITFTISGLWHGANWTFIFWGFLNGLYYIPLMLRGTKVKDEIVAVNSMLPSFRQFAQIVGTFLIIDLAWIFFRADSMTQAVSYIGKILSPSLFTLPKHFDYVIILIVILIFVEWVQRRKEHPMQIETLPVAVRWASYMVMVYAELIFFEGGQAEPFIYFQF